MALVLKDRVKETSTTTGTGAVTLLGASTGFQAFSPSIGVGNTTYYTIVGIGTNDWEVGIGTLSATSTLTRDTVLSSSNSGLLVSFSAGTKDVFVTYPASEAVPKSFLDGAYQTVTYNTATNVYTSGSWVLTSDISANDASIVGLTFSPDGLNMYTVGDATDSIIQYTLSRAYDVSSATYTRTLFVGGGSIFTNTTSQPRGITFDTTGVYMYLINGDTASVMRYTLGTAFNISTAGASNTTFSVGAQTGSPGFNIQFRSDGLTMFICGNDADVYTYTLSVAWDQTTATFVRNNNFITSQRGFVFSSDGFKLFTIDTTGNITRRSLGTAWDTSTAGATDQTVAFSATNFPTATYSFPQYALCLNAAVTGLTTGQRIFSVMPGPSTPKYVSQFELGASNDLSLMLNPLFDITTSTSRQINITPGTVPVYIGRLGVPGGDYTGMTKQVLIATATVLRYNASYINTLGNVNMSLAAGTIIQITYTGSAWVVTDSDDTLKENLYGLTALTAGMLAWNPSGSTFTPRTLTSALDPGIAITNADGAAGNPTISNTGIRQFNQRSNTSTMSTLWHFQTYAAYSDTTGTAGLSPWANVGGNQGTYFIQQIGSGYNGTNTPDAFYRSKSGQTNATYGLTTGYNGAITYPRDAADRNNFLRTYYYIYTPDRASLGNNRLWTQRELIYFGETNWNTNTRAIRSMSEMVLGLNWLDGEDTPTSITYQGYAIPYQGDGSGNIQSGSVWLTGNFIVSGTSTSPSILAINYTATSYIDVYINGRAYAMTARSTTGQTIEWRGGNYAQSSQNFQFSGAGTMYFNYWAEGDISSRTYVRILVSDNKSATTWTYKIGEDFGGTEWRACILSGDRGSYYGGDFNRTPLVGYQFKSGRLNRIFSLKNMQVPLTTNGVPRPYTVYCRFRVDDITTQDQNVFWLSNGAGGNGIRVRINEGTVDRRLSINLTNSAGGGIVDRLKVWQYTGTGTWTTVTWCWNPLDTTNAGRLYVNDVQMFRTNSNPLDGNINWANMGATSSGTADSFIGYIDNFQVIPEVWGAYIPQGGTNLDVDQGNTAWTNATNNGDNSVAIGIRNAIGFRGYLRDSLWGIGANIRSDVYVDAPIIGAGQDSFTLTCTTVSGSNTLTYDTTLGGFPRNQGRFLITGANIPTTAGYNVWIYADFGNKSNGMYVWSGSANATGTGSTSVTFTRVNGTNNAGGFLQMPGNSIYVAKQNNVAVTFTNDQAGVTGGLGYTGTGSWPNISFTVNADAGINDYYITQNSAANNTAARALRAALSSPGGAKRYTLTGSGITATSATIDNALLSDVFWNNQGTGLHKISMQRNRNSAVVGGSTITCYFVPGPNSSYGDFELLAGNNASQTTFGPEIAGYSPQYYALSSTGNFKAMMATSIVGQWRYLRVTPPGGVYDSGIFKATSGTFVRNMYLGYGCIGYLINYGDRGDYNQSTAQPTITTINTGTGSNGMSANGISISTSVGTFYRVVIYPLSTTLIGSDFG
jgi:hypothetical protein